MEIEGLQRRVLLGADLCFCALPFTFSIDGYDSFVPSMVTLTASETGWAVGSLAKLSLHEYRVWFRRTIGQTTIRTRCLPILGEGGEISQTSAYKQPNALEPKVIPIATEGLSRRQSALIGVNGRAHPDLFDTNGDTALSCATGSRHAQLICPYADL
ncbi:MULTISPECIES: hypothetical protein [Falsihalocynthiibacter]|uniref:hypothetical protein n=1 Tax=Falsihalocynthiibacter TaxID=2854182 RepID=UPI003001F99D